MAQRYRCPICEYIYDEAKGDKSEGFPPGTRWVAIPANWACPICAVREKPDFIACSDIETDDQHE
ncbi:MULTISPECIES: rubredoxin [unclassified Methylibium]|uniref:rubredoxin n=1 Tax=unclassified Methylibium TaxID=2633235 RepID=UPI0003F42CEA|nr:MULTISPECIES: rubredoxin [unclassified Methylibium]EWS53973.1 Rubredoxin-1 [Methylibium sp. T29]EWS58286.1 Rubredoxin-1 [Methylibium sp. T29-B]